MGFLSRLFGRSPAKPAMVRAKFDVAQTSAENKKHWANADGLSSRAATSHAVRRVVRLRSRYEAENNSWYSGIIRTAANHIIGRGPRLQLLTPNVEANQRIEAAWRLWSSKVNFAAMLRVIFETYWRDGEVFVMRASRPLWYPIDLDLRTLEADQVSSPWDENLWNDPFVDDGIRFDRQTNELEYYVYDHHPGSNVPQSTLKGQWYRSEEVLHLYRVDRPGQIHGIPRATPALQTLPIMRRQELATLFSAETAANFAMYLKTNSSAIPPAELSQDFAEIEIARNMLTTLPEGWEIGQVEPKQPGPLYEMFQRQALMSFCRCTNMPYSLAAGTGKDSNFSSFKGDMKNVWEPEVLVEQAQLESLIVDRIFRWFLDSAVLAPGLLNGLPPTGTIDHQWHWPPLPELDANESAGAAALRVSTGQSTLTSEHAKRGQNWDLESVRAAGDFGVSPEVYRQAVFSKTFDMQPQNAVSVTTGGTPAASVADTAMNGAQVTSIVEIIGQVAARVIPAPTAKALIMSAFPAVPEQRVTEMLAPFASVTSPAISPDGMPQGEYTQLSQRAFTNNQKRIKKTLDQLIVGEISEVMAEQTLASIGMAPERISVLIEDARDGQVSEESVSASDSQEVAT